MTYLKFFLLAAVFCLSSCETIKDGAVKAGKTGIDGVVEISKTLWGSSTRALEKARDRAVTKTYDKPYWDCVRSAIAVIKKKGWNIFAKDEIKGFIVIINVRGSVPTTEVGIFFEEISDTQTRIEVSCLSTYAKRKVSRDLFHRLDIAFGYLPPDPPGTDEEPKMGTNPNNPNSPNNPNNPNDQNNEKSPFNTNPNALPDFTG